MRSLYCPADRPHPEGAIRCRSAGAIFGFQSRIQQIEIRRVLAATPLK
jgi:hypothetical protein